MTSIRPRSRDRKEPTFPMSPETMESDVTRSNVGPQALKSNSAPAIIRHNTNPIHHHIAPAIGAPFMKADGLIHRGSSLNSLMQDI